ncbi:MAG: DNA-packaging protein [Eubacteriaceae bacterium]|nr:DNA-packaging protein [Eubacteriaceae bacterium]
MSREIKFRAWDKANKCMLCIFDSTTQTDWILQNWNETYELMQYTGLKDKNGKDIYEGDVLQLGECTGVRRIIIWSKYSYATTNIKGEHVSIPLPHDWHKMHIIGNIHDNPELLEEGSR